MHDVFPYESKEKFAQLNRAQHAQTNPSRQVQTRKFDEKHIDTLTYKSVCPPMEEKTSISDTAASCSYSITYLLPQAISTLK